ncbi:tetratricopeptide repeat protein 41-like [Corticium candelabrum]|uniref:tetratricopeptide repeat protein 41-like n=1 Tax=Corticium candelabrum TaxID=121492 RepID=UPI002E27464C|nr:tetratricopeptide repeat protein 41-like [Corticium candelabrum]
MPPRRPALKRSISHAQRQFSWRQPIRPFVSSTFCDFQEERDYLVKHVFPRLDKACHERGTYFAPIDLRWGINESQSSQGHVIQLCLDYIRKSSPFFVCLLGERYGSHLPPNAPADHPSATWFEKNLSIAQMNGFEWLRREEFKHKSITELEVIQAAFEEESNAACAYFYMRDPGAVAIRLPSDLSDEERQARLAVFGAESEFAEKQMSALKERIVKSRLAVRRFNTVEELGKMLLDDWMTVINNEYPQLADSFANHEGDLFREWAAHESFAETRRRAFAQTPHISRISENLTHYVARLSDGKETKTQVVVVEGERGCGKTSVVANWMKAIAGSAPEIAFLSYYVGSSAASSDILSFLRYCTAEIRRFHTGSYMTPTEGDSNSANTQIALEAFHGALNLGPTIIMLDGLEEMSSEDYKNSELMFLPESMPKQCLFVITMAVDHPKLLVLKQRRDVEIHQLPLLSNDDDKKSVMQQHLVMHRKELNEHQYKKITSCDLSSRPLFLAALANEMRLFGKFKDVDKHLDHYLKSTSIEDLWSRIIFRWCQDYGWSSSSECVLPKSGNLYDNWVADLLRLIAVSRHGLSEQEILTVLVRRGYDNKHEVTSAMLALLRSAVMDALFEKPGGMLTFFHSHLQEAVTNNLFSTSNGDTTTADPNVYHKFLVDYFTSLPHSRRRAEELPWQLLEANETESLCKVLTEPDVFLQLTSDAGKNPLKLDLLKYWNVLHDGGYDESTVYLHMLKTQRSHLAPVKNDEDVPDSSASSQTDELEKLAATGQAVGQFLAERHKFDDALLVLQDALEDMKRCHEEQRYNHLLLTEIQESIGHRFLYKLEIQEAEKWYSMALETVALIESKGQREYELQGRILNALGQLYARGNKTEDAEVCLKQAAEYMTAAESTPGLATVDYNLGILRSRQKLFNEAETHLRQAVTTRERWFGMSHFFVAEVLNELAGLLVSRHWLKRDPWLAKEALDMYKRALNIRELHLGKSHLLVATTLFHTAKLLAHPQLSRKNEALCYLKRALGIRKEVLGMEHKLTKVIARTVDEVESGTFGTKQGNRQSGTSNSAAGDKVQQQPRHETKEEDGWQCVRNRRQSREIRKEDGFVRDRGQGRQGRGQGGMGRGSGPRRGSEPLPLSVGHKTSHVMRRVASESVPRSFSRISEESKENERAFTGRRGQLREQQTFRSTSVAQQANQTVESNKPISHTAAAREPPYQQSIPTVDSIPEENCHMSSYAQLVHTRKGRGRGSRHK